MVTALTHRIGIKGHPGQVIATQLGYSLEATATVVRCVPEEGGSGCRPDWILPAWSTMITSSIDNGHAGDDLWIVEGLPAAGGDLERGTRRHSAPMSTSSPCGTSA